ncbi:PREDICTED: cationic amino acid transporter 4 isoform X1 [Polistes canadensis]|uniref:cationic amino acid transporter 4 isoform X1 n=1 Tax=Polistes canadensis TaxID=91411 RepID=UPI000718DEF2|nr:PREDICTED: cationic amino acid transporter 4 isoform X1 [Polistes canadensis]XP_014598148.1 PREDICTED: cationic amino acid transporter 4 isoform X1 [Polistes canadensis]
MPSVRRMILGHVMSGLYTKLNRTKKLQGDLLETPMKRCLSTFDITLLGVGHMIGAGIYVLTGTVAHDLAGPGVVLSFLLAGTASLLAALCYAEFGAKVPKAGSAYVYTYVSIGEFWAFVIGWNIILEHMIGAASVARAWSGYVDSLAGGAFSNYTRRLMGGYTMGEPLGTMPDILASGLCLAYAMLLTLGVKCSAAVNSLLTLVNLAVMILTIVLGIYYADITNWSSENGGIFPYGFSGVLAGAATCFYAFVGFDSIATSGEEAINPAKSIPLATIFSMAIVTVGYVMVGGVLTLIVPYWNINPTAALPEAFASRGIPWAKYVISIGALCGMTTTLFGSLFSLPRTMYAMANDGLLFGFLGHISDRTQVPVLNLMISGLFSALIALLFDLQHLVEFMSIGTFLAYTIVSASVIVLRYRPEKTTPAASAAGTPSSLASPPTEGADFNSDCNSIASADAELLDCNEGVGKLKPRYSWLANFLGNCEPGTAVAIAVTIYTAASATLCPLLILLFQSSFKSAWNNYFALVNVIILIIGSLLVIGAHRQNPSNGRFRVPMVPLIPGLSILFNVGLMFHLSLLTWLRFFVWMIVGMLIYFLYGIHYSKEAVSPNSYSVLMATSEAVRGAKWGAMLRVNQKVDKVPILDENEH